MYDIRKDIDKIDDEIAKLLFQRLSCVKKIAEIKKANKINVLDKNREDEIKSRLSELASNEEKREYVLAIYDSIMSESKKVQEE